MKFYPCLFISYQAQKAKDKEENVEFLEQLDNNFTSLVNSEALLALTDPTKINALKALVNKSTSDNKEKIDVVSSIPKIVSLQQVEKIVVSPFLFLFIVSLFTFSKFKVYM